MTVKTTKKILAAMLVAIMFVGFVFTATPVKKVQAATTGTVINVNRAVNVRTKPSINATVVILDRIRYNLKMMKDVTSLRNRNYLRDSISRFLRYFRICHMVQDIFYKGWQDISGLCSNIFH